MAEIRVVLENFVDQRIVVFQGRERVFLIDEVESDKQLPFGFAHSPKMSLVDFWLQKLEPALDVASKQF